MNKPITLCDRCDICMSCLLDYDGIPCRRNRTVEPTNADRIRAMTNADLALFINKVKIDGALRKNELPTSVTDWLNWLEQEVEE